VYVIYGAGLSIKGIKYNSSADTCSNRSVTQSLHGGSDDMLSRPGGPFRIHTNNGTTILKEHISSISAGIHNDTSSLLHNVLVCSALKQSQHKRPQEPSTNPTSNPSSYLFSISPTKSCNTFSPAGTLTLITNLQKPFNETNGEVYPIITHRKLSLPLLPSQRLSRHLEIMGAEIKIPT